MDIDPSAPFSSAIAAASSLIKDGIDKIWPNPTEEAAAKVSLLKAQTDAAIAQLDAANRAANAEAASSDKWTSRARPAALYVLYAMILFGIPMGFVSAFNPVVAANVAKGMQAWMAAIPDTLWQCMTVMFSVYGAGRTIEKVKGAAR